MLDFELSDQAQAEYESWLEAGNFRIADKIDALIASAQETPFDGIGKPEPLKHQLSGKWSRRITSKDRLVYEVSEGVLLIHQCKGHY